MTPEITRGNPNFPTVWRELKRTNRLHELLDPKPEDKAKEIFDTIKSSKEGTIHIVGSTHMFSGKTTTAILAVNMLIDELDKEAIAFRPIKSRKPDEKESEISTLYRGEDVALDPKVRILNTDANLQSVLQSLENEGLNKKNRPVVFIDELMFYEDHGDNAQEVMEVLEKIRELGCDVIVTALTRNFRNEPFFFFEDLVETAKEESWKEKEWFVHEMSTKCYYCGEKAKVTQRRVVDKDTGEERLAYEDEETLVSGRADSYTAICGECGHDSCQRRE